MSTENNIEKLKKLINQIKNLEPSVLDTEFLVWKKNVERVLTAIFAKNSIQHQQFSEITFLYDPERDLKEAALLLESFLEEIPTKDELTKPKNITDNTKVFVVHGRDEEAKQTVARFLSKLKLQLIILHEQASKGKTIIEKFEHYSDVGFAVVLLTPDDRGCLEMDFEKHNELTDKVKQLKSRGRQNVILELGFFFAKLGRQNVVVLVKPDVEKPSDVDGIVYIPFDSGNNWQSDLIKELKAAGINVDANSLYE
ncbi:MAG: nucleotide-binding protein [Nitrosopumilaceae archaeon]